MRGLGEYRVNRLVWISLLLLSIVGFILLIGVAITAASNPVVLKVCKEGCTYNLVQTAIEAADSKDTVLVKGGTYKENLTIDKSLTLKGEGDRKVKINGVEKGHPVLLIGPSDVDVNLVDLSLQGAKGKLCSDREKGICPAGLSMVGKSRASLRGLTINENGREGIWVQDFAKATIENSEIRENGRYGIWLFGSAWADIESSHLENNVNGVMLIDSTSAELSNTNVTSNGYGLSLFGSAEIVIKDSQIKGNKRDGIRLLNSARATLERNEILNNAEHGIILWDSTEATIENNTLLGNEVGVTNYSDRKVQCSGNRITKNTVDLVGNLDGGSREKTEEPAERKIALPDDDYPTLQHAIDALLPGGTIVIEEKLKGGAVIDKKMTLKAGEKLSQLYLSKETVAPVLSLINGAGLIIDRIELTGSGGEGIIAAGNANLQVKKATIDGNRGDGVELWDSAQAMVSNSKLTDNGHSGIRIVDSAQATIEDSQITKNKLDGLLLAGSSYAEIRNTEISENEGNGISLTNSAQAAVENCDIVGNKTYGISLSALAKATVGRSKINKNREGLVIEDSSQFTVTDSSILNNKTGIEIFEPDKFKGTLKGSGNRIGGNDTDFKGVPDSIQQELIS